MTITELVQKKIIVLKISHTDCLHLILLNLYGFIKLYCINIIMLNSMTNTISSCTYYSVYLYR